MTHPMTPPQEVVDKLRDAVLHPMFSNAVSREKALVCIAYQYGADAELNACCGWIESQSEIGELSFIPEVRTKFRCEVSDRLRAARRPAPPPTPEQQALDACSTALAAGRLSPSEASIIRLALEAQP